MILLNAAGLLSCGDDAGCPDQILDPSSAPCCVDDRVCEQVEPRGYFGSTIAVSVGALCGVGQCETDLEAALASPACDSVRIGCGLTEVHAFKPGYIFATPVYDSETGELVGASGNSNEGYTRSVDGCCGAQFRAGDTLAGCAEITDGACADLP